MTYSFVVNFRNGIYCTQVESENVFESVLAWTQIIKSQKKEIKFLGDKIIRELEILAIDNHHRPVLLIGLKSIWFTTISTRQGTFYINIIQTDTS